MQVTRDFKDPKVVQFIQSVSEEELAAIVEEYEEERQFDEEARAAFDSPEGEAVLQDFAKSYDPKRSFPQATLQS